MIEQLIKLRSTISTWPAAKTARLAAAAAGMALLAYGAVSCGGTATADAGDYTPLGTTDLALRLGAVLALVIVALAAVRRYLGPQAASIPYRQRVRVVDRCRLGPQQTLYVVAIENRALLLGATATNITALTELEQPDTYLPAPAEPPEGTFARHLNAFGFSPPVHGAGNTSFARHTADTPSTTGERCVV